jgi:hypothetical protein
MGSMAEPHDKSWATKAEERDVAGHWRHAQDRKAIPVLIAGLKISIFVIS